jgi:hypothetical protein
LASVLAILITLLASLLELLGLLNEPGNLEGMQKLENVGIIRVITKTVSGLLFLRARSNLMVAITAIKA